MAGEPSERGDSGRRRALFFSKWAQSITKPLRESHRSHARPACDRGNRNAARALWRRPLRRLAGILEYEEGAVKIDAESWIE